MVDRLLARSSTARARTGGEDHRIGTSDVGRHLVDRRVFEIDDDGLGAGSFQIRGLSRVADEARHRVAAPRQQPLEFARDLAVPACDQDAQR